MREIMSRKLFFASISVGIPTVNDVRHQHYCSLDTTTLPTSHTGYSRYISGNFKRSTFNILFSVPWHFYCGKMCTYVIHFHIWYFFLKKNLFFQMTNPS